MVALKPEGIGPAVTKHRADLRAIIALAFDFRFRLGTIRFHREIVTRRKRGGGGRDVLQIEMNGVAAKFQRTGILDIIIRMSRGDRGGDRARTEAVKDKTL